MQVIFYPNKYMVGFIVSDDKKSDSSFLQCVVTSSSLIQACNNIIAFLSIDLTPLP